MKHIIMSIKDCGSIFQGTQSFIMQKSMPKINPPYKVYLYQTMPKYGDVNNHNGKVVAEFVCDSIFKIGPKTFVSNKESSSFGVSHNEFERYANGKNVYGWHISDLVIYDIPKGLSDPLFYIIDKAAVRSCPYRFRVGQPETRTKHGGWIKGSFKCERDIEDDWCCFCKTKPLKYPPQSWCYLKT